MAHKPVVKIKEEDLYKPVCEYLEHQGYTVNSEVKDCDVTAVKEDKLVVVELKKSLNLELLLQAVKRQKITDSVYVAVPHPGKRIFSSRWRDLCHMLRRLELGLILVSLGEKGSGIRIEFHPQEFDRERSKKANYKRKLAIIEEIGERHGDYNTGGSSKKKLVTAYREKSIHIACCLERFGSLKPKQLKLLGTDEKKTGGILMKNYYGWFDRQGSGIYSLNESGRLALNEHWQLADIFKREIPLEIPLINRKKTKIDKKGTYLYE